MHGFVLRNRICRRCGLVYLSERMDEGDLEEFYRRGYRRLNDGSEAPTELNIAQQRARMLPLVDAARRIVPAVRRHLDIGCSAGILMTDLREAYGCEPVGVEPGIGHRNAALAKGLRVYASLDEAAEAEWEPFDLITLSHVLEHLPDPAGVLARIRKQFLCAGGYLLVEVPNLYAHSCFEPAHLFSFSRKTLHDVLKMGGYEPVYTILHGVPPTSWRPRYLLAIARPARRAISRKPGRSWGGVRVALLRRKWGMRNSRGLLQIARALGRRLQGACTLP